jgi:vancomycin resistance protein YoaR
MIIVVLAAGSFVALGFYVDSLDTVFPNVWADGINISGMTLQEAVTHMIYVGYENNAEGISATVVFPDDTSFSVTGIEVGLSFNAAEAAAIAFAFGRDETFFRNEMTYIRSLFERTELNDLSSPIFDDSIIRQLAAEYTEQFNKTLIESSLDRNENYITVTRGSGLHPAVETSVVALALDTLNHAISEHDNISVRYIPESNANESVDLQIFELQMIFDEIHEDPVSAQVMYIEDELVITESTYGLTFDFDLAVGSLLDAPIGHPVTIPMIILTPEYSQEEVRGWIFRDVLGSSRTREQSGNTNRLRNIQVAAEFINGTILNPGDEFSFNEVVGPRRSDRGFREANVIEGGVFVPGIGGGICQVSSTIHDAVMHTTLPVTQRRPHGLAIRYMPRAEEGLLTLPDSISDPEHSINRFIDGRRIASDAMVSWGTSDYKFRNNTDFPVKVEATVSGRYLEIILHGTNLEGTHIQIETVILSVTPFGTAEEPDETLPVGERRPKTGASGQPGLSAEIYQLLFSSDGELISRTLFEWRDDGNTRRISRYSAQSRTTLVGVMEAPPQTGGGEHEGGHGDPHGGGNDHNVGDHNVGDHNVGDNNEGGGDGGGDG